MHCALGYITVTITSEFPQENIIYKLSLYNLEDNYNNNLVLNKGIPCDLSTRALKINAGALAIIP